jgi:hypothetical protein
MVNIFKEDEVGRHMENLRKKRKIISTLAL